MIPSSLLLILLFPVAFFGQAELLPLPLDNLNRDSLFNVIKIKERQGDFAGLGRIYSGLYTYYLTTPFKDSATDYAIKCEEYALKAGDSAIYYNALSDIGYLAVEAHNAGTAITYLLKALPFYLRSGNNTMLFHVYGNLGYAYQQLNHKIKSAYYDSLALKASQLSKNVWTEIVTTDGVIHRLMDENKIDESIALLKENLIRINSSPEDGKGKQYKVFWRGIELNLLSMCYYKKGHFKEAIKYLHQAAANDTGRMMNDQAIESNRLLANSFIHLGLTDSALKYTDRMFNQVIDKFEKLDPAKQNEISVKYEAEKKQREINALKQKQELQQLSARNQRNLNIAFIIIIILLFASGYYFIKNLHNKRKIAAENAMKQLIQKDELHHRKELELRNRISRDLHDDIGSSLSSIKAYSEILKTNPKHPSLPELITENAGDLIERLEVIVWASNPQFDTYGNLIVKMKKYAEPLLRVKGINYSFDAEGISMDEQIPGQLRQNILLIFKEAVNNVAKYSNAENCRSHLFIEENKFTMNIADDGVGITEDIKGSGYGMSSMKKRTSEIDGEIHFQSHNGRGTMITLKLAFPFNIPV